MRNCPTLRRAHESHDASGSGGTGASSRSSTTISCPSRASSIAAAIPQMPPPATTILAIFRPLWRPSDLRSP